MLCSIWIICLSCLLSPTSLCAINTDTGIFIFYYICDWTDHCTLFCIPVDTHKYMSQWIQDLSRMSALFQKQISRTFSGLLQNSDWFFKGSKIHIFIQRISIDTFTRVQDKPCLYFIPRALPISNIHAVPLDGSIPPYTQASRWFPNKINLSKKWYNNHVFTRL